MPKDKKTALEYVQSTLLNTEVMSYIFTGLLVFVLLLVSFIDFSNLKVGFDRLTEAEFWRTFILRFAVVQVSRWIYINLGTKKETDTQIDLDAEITIERSTIESSGRLDEFDMYAKEVIDIVDTLDVYEHLLTKKIIKWQSKTKKRSKVEVLLKERKTLRDYRQQFMLNLDRKLVDSEFDVDNIILSGKVDITADILFDGYNETSNGLNVSVAYNQIKESRSSLNKGALMSIIITLALTFFINDILLSGDNWKTKLVNLSVSLLIMVVSIILALYTGKNIGVNVGISKGKRVRYMKSFSASPVRTYIKERPRTHEEEPILDKVVSQEEEQEIPQPMNKLMENEMIKSM